MKYPKILLFNSEQGFFHIEKISEAVESAEDGFTPIDVIKNESQDLLIHNFTRSMYLINAKKGSGVDATIQQVKLSLALFKLRNELLFAAKKLPEEPGIYFIYDKNKQLAYVGKSENLRKRLPVSISDRKAVYYKFACTDSCSAATIYETYYIHKFRPKLNSCKYYDDLNIKMPDLIFTDFIEVNSKI